MGGHCTYWGLVPVSERTEGLEYLEAQPGTGDSRLLDHSNRLYSFSFILLNRQTITNRFSCRTFTLSSSAVEEACCQWNVVNPEDGYPIFMVTVHEKYTFCLHLSAAYYLQSITIQSRQLLLSFYLCL